MVPGALAAFKSLYWGYRRDPRHIGHRVHILARTIWSGAHLWLIRIIYFRRKLVVIGMIGAMGDIVACEPISRAARRQFPNAHIVWVVRQPFAEIVARFEAVDTRLVVTCLTEWMLLAAFRPPCTVWNLHLADAYCAKCRAPMPHYGRAAGVTSDTYYGLGNLLANACQCAGVSILDDAPRFDPGETARHAVEALRLPDRFVLLHCASNDPNRNWLDESRNELAIFIHETLGWSIVEVGLAPVTQGAKSGLYIDLCDKISLPEMAEVIRRASLFIGIDSGPAHLANAMRTPGVLVFGRFHHWDRYMAYSGYYETGGADILWADGPASHLPVTEVEKAVELRIAHATEGRRWNADAPPPEANA
jgi:heptosyltransferase-3